MKACRLKEVCSIEADVHVLELCSTNSPLGKLDDISVVAAQCKRRKT
jgi:hypothetical protein